MTKNRAVFSATRDEHPRAVRETGDATSPSPPSPWLRAGSWGWGAAGGAPLGKLQWHSLVQRDAEHPEEC